MFSTFESVLLTTIYLENGLLHLTFPMRWGKLFKGFHYLKWWECNSVGEGLLKRQEARIQCPEWDMHVYMPAERQTDKQLCYSSYCACQMMFWLYYCLHAAEAILTCSIFESISFKFQLFWCFLTSPSLAMSILFSFTPFSLVLFSTNWLLFEKHRGGGGWAEEECVVVCSHVVIWNWD